jgi:hypothetical protein
VGAAPLIDAVAQQSGTVGVSAPLNLSATGGTGGAVNYLAEGLPPGMAVNRASGAITGVPTAAGRFVVNVFADNGSARTSTEFVWRIAGGTAPPANRAPTVSLTAPASAVQGSAVTLNATAADADGTIARVEFFAGTTLLNTDTTAPYSFSWAGAAPGTYSLTARAVDNAGASTTSAAVTLTVTSSATPPAGQPPSTALGCAAEGLACTLPAGSTATVWYGTGTTWAVRTGVTGSISCTNAVFGDPAPGSVKVCRFQVTSTGTTTPPPTTPPATAVACAREGATCALPAGRTATVWYGAGTAWRTRTGVTGSIGCTNAVFGDPAPGIVKSCRYQ